MDSTRYRKITQILRASKYLHSKLKRDEIIREVFESDSKEKDPYLSYCDGSRGSSNEDNSSVDSNEYPVCGKQCYNQQAKSLSSVSPISKDTSSLRWTSDGNEAKGILSSLDLLLLWISDEKNSSRYLGFMDSHANDNGFSGDGGKTKLALCNEICRYIKDNNIVQRSPESVRYKISSLLDSYKKTSDRITLRG